MKKSELIILLNKKSEEDDNNRSGIEDTELGWYFEGKSYAFTMAALYAEMIDSFD